MRLDVGNLSFDYSDHEVLRAVDLTVEEGDILGLVGPNGSGKSTLIKCINRVLTPDAGSVLVGDTDVGRLGREEVAKTMGYVAQQDGQTYSATVFDTVLMGRKPYISWRPGAEDLDRVATVLDDLGLNDLSLRDVNTLSGGQAQKVMVGRALAQDPDILLLDEPTSDLDVRHQLEVMDVVETEIMQGLSGVVAMHDLNLAARYCDKIAMLKDGDVYTTGPTGEVLTSRNIEAVFGVTATTATHGGRRIVIPEAPTARDNDRDNEDATVDDQQDRPTTDTNP